MWCRLDHRRPSSARGTEMLGDGVMGQLGGLKRRPTSVLIAPVAGHLRRCGGRHDRACAGRRDWSGPGCARDSGLGGGGLSGRRHLSGRRLWRRRGRVGTDHQWHPWHRQDSPRYVPRRDCLPGCHHLFRCRGENDRRPSGCGCDSAYHQRDPWPCADRRWNHRACRCGMFQRRQLRGRAARSA